MVKDRSEVLSPGSVELVYRWVASIFRVAVGDRITASPCVGIKLPKRNCGEIVPLAPEVVESMASAVPERFRAIILFAAGTGLRQGECFGLTVDRVDFLRKQVRVDRQLLGVKDGRPVFGPPKTEASSRTVPRPSVVTETLAEHLARFDPGPGDVIFTNQLGRPLRRNTFNEMWHRAAGPRACRPVPPSTTSVTSTRHS